MTKAFTLVESLVTIFIIALLSLIILPNYSSTSQQLALQRSAFKLAQDIRRVQEMAMSAQEFEGEIPDGGYGIYLRTVPPKPPQTSYILYADKIYNRKYDSGVGAGETIEQINFEKGIKILSINGNHLNVIFTPPDPIVFFTDAEGENLNLDEISIVICLISDESKTKTITINKAGLINIE